MSEGAGATILPWSVANQVALPGRSAIRQISSPKIEDTVSLCVSDLIPLSEAAVAIRGILFEIATAASASGRLSGTKAGAAQ